MTVGQHLITAHSCTHEGGYTHASGRDTCDWKQAAYPGHRPRGVTFLELLVVLVLMAISAALVVPALRVPVVTSDASGFDADSGRRERDGESRAMASREVDPVLTAVRRLAITRGEPLRMKMASDGVWAVVPLKGGSAVLTGRVTAPLTWLPDVTIDALGTCVLAETVVPAAGSVAWDALACRWRGRTP